MRVGTQNVGALTGKRGDGEKEGQYMCRGRIVATWFKGC